MQLKELLDHITLNQAQGRSLTHNLVYVRDNSEVNAEALNLTVPEMYCLRKVPEVIKPSDNIRYSPPSPPDVDYRKLNELIYERIGKDTDILFKIVQSIAIKSIDGWYLSTDERNVYPELDEVHGFKDALVSTIVPRREPDPLIPYRVFYTRNDLADYVIDVLRKYKNSAYGLTEFIEAIKSGHIEL